MNEREVKRLADPGREIRAIWRRWMAAHLGTQGLFGDLDNAPNCIADAEALEVLLLPNTEIESLSLLDVTVQTDAAHALSSVIDPTAREKAHLTPASRVAIIDRLHEYYERYAADGQHFDPGTYISEPDSDSVGSQFPPVVDGFTLSISLCLHTKELTRRWAELSDRWADADLIDRRPLLATIEKRADERLTAAMEGLVRSFCVFTMDDDVWRRTGRPWPESDERSGPVLRQLRRLLEPYADRSIIETDVRFECGWSWGQVRRSTDVQAEGDAGKVLALPDVWSEGAPYLYFTVTAIDGIADLFSPRVRGLKLLDDRQAALAAHLGFLWQLTSDYWRAIAFAPGGKVGGFAIEDVPWVTTDGERPDYWSLYVLRIITASPEGSSLGGDLVERLTQLAEELAQRARVSRKVGFDQDLARSLHSPGGSFVHLRADLHGQPKAIGNWRFYDFAPQLLKVAGRLVAMRPALGTRRRLSRLIDEVWAHLSQRRAAPVLIEAETYSAWDDFDKLLRYEAEAEGKRDPSEAQGDPTLDDLKSQAEPIVPSWYVTERMIEALVSVYRGYARPLEPSTFLREESWQLVDELRAIALVDPRLASTGYLDDLAEIEDDLERNFPRGFGALLRLVADYHAGSSGHAASRDDY